MNLNLEKDKKMKTMMSLRLNIKGFDRRHKGQFQVQPEKKQQQQNGFKEKG